MANHSSCVIIFLSALIISVIAESTFGQVPREQVSSDSKELKDGTDGPIDVNQEKYPILEQRGYEYHPEGIGRIVDGIRNAVKENRPILATVQSTVKRGYEYHPEGIGRVVDGIRNAVKEDRTPKRQGSRSRSSSRKSVVGNITGGNNGFLSSISGDKVQFNDGVRFARMRGFGGKKKIVFKNNQMLVDGELVCSNTEDLSPHPTYQKTHNGGAFWHTNMKVGKPMSSAEIKIFEDDWVNGPETVSTVSRTNNSNGNTNVEPATSSSDFQSESNKWAKITEERLRKWEAWAKANGYW